MTACNLLHVISLVQFIVLVCELPNWLHLWKQCLGTTSHRLGRHSATWSIDFMDQNAIRTPLSKVSKHCHYGECLRTGPAADTCLRNAPCRVQHDLCSSVTLFLHTRHCWLTLPYRHDHSTQAVADTRVRDGEGLQVWNTAFWCIWCTSFSKLSSLFSSDDFFLFYHTSQLMYVQSIKSIIK